jgi:hypothetical protein
VREDGVVGLISILDTGRVIHMHLVEVDLIILVLCVVLTRDVLVNNWDPNAFVLLNYLLHIER